MTVNHVAKFYNFNFYRSDKFEFIGSMKLMCFLRKVYAPSPQLRPHSKNKQWNPVVISPLRPLLVSSVYVAVESGHETKRKHSLHSVCVSEAEKGKGKRIIIYTQVCLFCLVQ